ncbi:hypothetical protein [Aequorivita capsosiphonis]|uniref:hypothetical protein n=1 Tax=Aequorivita capsosiphonis TaxID=487317 RepID=UPI00047B48FD|nr:hypothetical protein [Aequorivita capsosiphonis]
MASKNFLRILILIVIIFSVLISCTKESEDDEGPNGWCLEMDAKAYYNDLEFDITSGYFIGEEDPDNLDNSIVIGMVSDCMQLRNGQIEGVEGMFVTFELLADDHYFKSGVYNSEAIDHMAVRNFKFIPKVTPGTGGYEIIEAEYVSIKLVTPYDSPIGLYEIDITANLKNGKVFICRYDGGFYEALQEINL